MFAVFVVVMLCAVNCQPVEKSNIVPADFVQVHVPPSDTRALRKRFINPSSGYGGVGGSGISNLRTKRSWAEECERLQLCRLHARSAHSFLAAYELYFVNKENARLWDHRARSAADCERRFSC